MIKAKGSQYIERLVIGLFIYMPFHLFLSRWLSVYTGGLMAWEVGKDIITLVGLGLAGWLFWQYQLYRNKRQLILVGTIAAYGLLHLAFLLYGDKYDQRALIMGTLYNLRFFAWLCIGLVAGSVASQELVRKVVKIILVTALVVALFGLLQWVLPKTLMEHFGYSVERGAKPAFFIDDKPDFPRIMSTIRDPNSLGAFLILPLTLVWLRFFSATQRNRRLQYAGMGAVFSLAIVLTFSRSALLGAIIALGLATLLRYRTQIGHLARRFVIPLIVVMVLVGGAGAVFYQTYTFQNLVLHSDEKTKEADPNEKRVQVQSLAIKEIRQHPFGHAPGTSGLIAISNTKGGLITENYFLQIGFETGVVGLIMFLTLLYLSYRLLLEKSAFGEERIALLASFWAYMFISLLIHLWSNESVALQFWMLAGLVIANITTGSPAAHGYNKQAVKKRG